MRFCRAGTVGIHDQMASEVSAVVVMVPRLATATECWPLNERVDLRP